MWKNSHVNLCSCHNAFFVLKDTSPSSRAGNLLLVQPSGTSSATSGALSFLQITERLNESASEMSWKTMSRMWNHKSTLHVFYFRSITALFQTSLTPTYNRIDFLETAHSRWHTEKKIKHSWCAAKSNKDANHHRSHWKIIQKLR